MFQNADRRVIFAIPFERDFTLIGTTERDYRGDPAAATSQAEIAYLCGAANEYFRTEMLGLRMAPEEIARLDTWMKAAQLEGTPA